MARLLQDLDAGLNVTQEQGVLEPGASRMKAINIPNKNGFLLPRAEDLKISFGIFIVIRDIFIYAVILIFMIHFICDFDLRFLVIFHGTKPRESLPHSDLTWVTPGTGIGPL